MGLLLFSPIFSLSAATTTEVDEEFRNQLKQAIESADSFVDKFAAEVWLEDMSSRLADRAKHIPCLLYTSDAADE